MCEHTYSIFVYMCTLYILHLHICTHKKIKFESYVMILFSCLTISDRFEPNLLNHYGNKKVGDFIHFKIKSILRIKDTFLSALPKSSTDEKAVISKLCVENWVSRL